MSLINDFKIKFTNFDTSKVDTNLPQIIDDYKYYYGAEYGSNSGDNTIILYLLAHLYYTYIESLISAETPKIESSRSVGKTSVSFDTSIMGKGNDDAFFSSTVYGMQYLRLIRKNISMYYV